MECAWEPWEVLSKPWALDPMLSALGRRSPPARLPMRLTWGDTDSQMLSQGAAPTSMPSLGSPSVQNTHCPETGQCQHNKGNLLSNCP